jgi:hypothetical protein
MIMVAVVDDDTAAGADWPEEAASRIRSAWKLSPPLPDISGDAFVQALLQCGWSIEGQDESAFRLVREGRGMLVPRHTCLGSAVVASLAIEGDLGPLTLIAALERSIWPPSERGPR